MDWKLFFSVLLTNKEIFFEFEEQIDGDIFKDVVLSNIFIILKKFVAKYKKIPDIDSLQLLLDRLPEKEKENNLQKYKDALKDISEISGEVDLEVFKDQLQKELTNFEMVKFILKAADRVGDIGFEDVMEELRTIMGKNVPKNLGVDVTEVSKVVNLIRHDVTEKISVEVLAEYDLYPEPIMEWGRTRESIISELGEPDANLSNSIGYFFYSPNAPVLMYVFDENDKLESSSVFVKTVFSSELAAFLLERYVYASQDEGVFYFLNGLNLEQSSMSIASSIYNLNYWRVVYFPVENLTTKSMKRNMFQNIFQEFKSLEKSLYK